MDDTSTSRHLTWVRRLWATDRAGARSGPSGRAVTLFLVLVLVLAGVALAGLSLGGPSRGVPDLLVGRTPAIETQGLALARLR